MSPEKKDHFHLLVLMFQNAALQSMGKLVNPLTNKTETDLEQAQYAIDVLGMLEEKTRGNLSEDEKKFLEGVLAHLRLNFVDERGKPKEESGGGEKKETI